MGPQYGTCLVSPLRRIQFRFGPRFVENPCCPHLAPITAALRHRWAVSLMSLHIPYAYCKYQMKDSVLIKLHAFFNLRVGMWSTSSSSSCTFSERPRYPCNRTRTRGLSGPQSRCGLSGGKEILISRAAFSNSRA